MINAAVTFSSLAGLSMSGQVVSTWWEVAKHFMDITALQAQVAERLASLLNVQVAAAQELMRSVDPGDNLNTACSLACDTGSMHEKFVLTLRQFALSFN